MDIPWESLVKVLALWTVVVLAYSVAVAMQVAAATGRSRVRAVVLALAIPVLGPWVWAAVEYTRLRKSGYSAWSGRTAVKVVLGAVLFWVASALLITALFVPWLHAQAVVDGRFSGRVDPTPIDTVLGAATLFAAATAFVGLGFVSAQQAMRRVALFAGSVATLLLLLALSSAIVYRQVDGTGEAIRGLTGKTVGGDLSVGLALWLTAAAGVLGVAGAVLAAIGAGRRPIPAATGSTSNRALETDSWGVPAGGSGTAGWAEDAGGW